MICRCPYCQHLVEGEPQPICPACGKVRVVPKMREPNPRLARQRVIENIWRENEQKKATLQGTLTPSTFRNPKLYFGLMLFMGIAGLILFSATDKAVERKHISPEQRTRNNLDVLAEALGRYRFHTGAYPTLRQGGLAALVREPAFEQAPNWDGPYISHLAKDAWNSPFFYVPPADGNELPDLFSSGPDQQPNTPDDLRPDPSCFDPGTDWTNGWVRAHDRLPGVTVGQ